tara:strand:+ start:204 stop:350 length:147 start_codon:yes stop_codon:yes gene_type:complete
MLSFGAIFCWIGIWARNAYFPNIDESFAEYLVLVSSIYENLKDIISDW